MIEVDARGLACPIPVVKTQKAITENPKDEILVLVSDPSAKDNVSRFAQSNRYTVNSEEIEGYFRLILKPN